MNSYHIHNYVGILILYEIVVIELEHGEEFREEREREI